MPHTTASTGPFDLITGLPVHVLITHAVVVLLPLAVLTLILVITIPELRSHYRYPAVGLAIVGAISAIIAEQSGQALQARVGYPGEHAEWGGDAPPSRRGTRSSFSYLACRVSHGIVSWKSSGRHHRWRHHCCRHHCGGNHRASRALGL